jgi:hypothetical protein
MLTLPGTGILLVVGPVGDRLPVVEWGRTKRLADERWLAVFSDAEGE